MTASVEINWAANSTGKLSQQSMTLINGNAATEELGKHGNVDVIDVKPLAVVAIGVGGKRSQALMDRNHQNLSDGSSFSIYYSYRLSQGNGV